MWWWTYMNTECNHWVNCRILFLKYSNIYNLQLPSQQLKQKLPTNLQSLFPWKKNMLLTDFSAGTLSFFSFEAEAVVSVSGTSVNTFFGFVVVFLTSTTTVFSVSVSLNVKALFQKIFCFLIKPLHHHLGMSIQPPHLKFHSM